MSGISSHLAVYAGKKAFPLIKDEGFNPDRIKVMTGAAGGPKWLVLYGLDKVLFPRFNRRREPLFALGSSIGVWRFFASALGEDARERFRNAYIEQRYTERPTPEEVTGEGRKILDSMIGEQRAADVLHHPWMRLSILSVRSRHFVKSERHGVQLLGLMGAMLVNAAYRRGLRYFFERSLFYDNRHRPPFFEIDDFPTQKIVLASDNIVDAVLASGAIPLIMSGIKDIAGAKKGMYRDGGMIDYHIDVEYCNDDSDGIVLFPHYTDRLVPGWLDKKLFYRKPVSKSRDNMLFICPSREFIASLPLSKIPDRDDFMLFIGNDGDRIDYWNIVADRSDELGLELHELIASGKIRHHVKPLPW